MVPDINKHKTSIYMYIFQFKTKMVKSYLETSIFAYLYPIPVENEWKQNIIYVIFINHQINQRSVGLVQNLVKNI